VVPEKIIEFQKGNRSVKAGDLIYKVEGITFGFEICEDAWIKKDRGTP
jgi:NAD+ synthase (glutamine-hydrolysing)